MSSSRARTRTWPAISPAVRLRMMPILPGQAEGALHRAADLGREAEGAIAPACRGSGMKTDSISWPSARREQELRRAVGRPFLLHDVRRRDRGSVAAAARAARGRGRSSARSRSRRACGSTGRAAGRGSADGPARRAPASSSGRSMPAMSRRSVDAEPGSCPWRQLGGAEARCGTLPFDHVPGPDRLRLNSGARA